LFEFVEVFLRSYVAYANDGGNQNLETEEEKKLILSDEGEGIKKMEDKE
jgi:hypothetical protein